MSAPNASVGHTAMVPRSRWEAAEQECADLRAEMAKRAARAAEVVTGLLEALREIETICTESAGDCRRRMGTRVGNTIVTARAAIAKAVQP